MTRSITLAILLAVSLSLNAANATLLFDGSFEQATGGGITSNSAWVLSANIPNNFDYSTQFQTAPFAASNGNTGVWYKSFTGLGNGSPLTATSVLVQNVTAPSDGIYQLTFDAARELNFLADEWYVALVANTAGGGLQDSVNLLTAAIPPGNFSQNVSQFTLTLNGVVAGNNIGVYAVMTGGRDAGANPQSAFLDNFNLVLVPEPASILLIGLGALGLGVLRRRS